MEERPFRPEELLEHRGFLAGLSRALVGSTTGAEDVVQEAFVAALRKPPPRGTPLRAWLATVLKNLAFNRARSDRRRIDLERSVSRAEAIDEGESEVERLELAARLIAIVQGLEAPYRSTLFLRFYDGLGVAEIARRQRVPRETVKTRVRRGLSLVRARLEEIHGGDRSAWMSAVGAFAAWSNTHTTESLVGRGLTDGLPLVWRTLTMKKLVGSALVLVLLFGGWGAFRGQARDRAIAVDRAVAVRGASEHVSRPSTDSASRGEELGVERGGRAAVVVPVTPDADSTMETASTLRIQVLWEEDRTPAPGIGMLLYPSSFRDGVDVRRLFSDRAGRVEIEGLAPGRVVVQAFRGGIQVLEVPAQDGVEFLVPTGVEVEGRVVDPEGRPVGDAGIWVSNRPSGWLGSHLATKTGPDGRYSLRDLQPDRSISARASGFGPSLRQALSERRQLANEPLQIDLELSALGGVLLGKVVDPEGVPVEGAWIGVGSETRGRAGRTGVDAPSAPPVLTRTGPGGRFRTEGIAPGAQVAVRVMAPGFPAVEERVGVRADEPTEVLVRMQTGASVRGWVTDARERPLAGVRVFATQRDGERMDRMFFPPPSAVSGSDGSYVLSSLPAGELTLEAHAQDELTAPGRTELAVELGETYSWSPRLGRAWVVSGRLVDQHGLPLGDWRVGARSEDAAEDLPLAVGTDRHGLFSLFVERQGLYTLTAGRADPAEDQVVANGVPAGAVDLHLVAETESPLHCTVFGEDQERRRTDRPAGADSSPPRARGAIDGFNRGDRRCVPSTGGPAR